MLKPNILIAVPAYGASNDTRTTACLMKITGHLRSAGIPFASCFAETTIEQARNVFGSSMLERKDFTHLFMIDSDMAPKGTIALDLLREEKPVIGVVAPMRRIDMNAFHAAAQRGLSFDASMASASEFNIQIADQKAFAQSKDRLRKVTSVGAGVMMIERAVFEQLATTGKVRSTAKHRFTDQIRGPLYGFFDPIRSNDQDFSEDISLCLRWRELCGGDVWALADDIGHVGDFVYRADVRESPI